MWKHSVDPVEHALDLVGVEKRPRYVELFVQKVHTAKIIVNYVRRGEM